MNRKERVEKDSLAALGIIAIVLFIIIGLSSIIRL
jgi:hypothetical protein